MHYALHKISQDLIVDMDGAFTFMDSDAFSSIMRAMMPSNDHPLFDSIKFNIEHLEKMDSYALDMMMRALDIAKHTHQRLVFEHPHGEVERKLRSAAVYNRSMIIAR